jgi:hypothetical protein
MGSNHFQFKETDFACYNCGKLYFKYIDIDGEKFEESNYSYADKIDYSYFCYDGLKFIDVRNNQEEIIVEKFNKKAIIYYRFQSCLKISKSFYHL